MNFFRCSFQARFKQSTRSSPTVNLNSERSRGSVESALVERKLSRRGKRIYTRKVGAI